MSASHEAVRTRNSTLRCQFFSVALGVCCLTNTGVSMAGTNTTPISSGFPRPGEWPSNRRNASLDAHSPVKGRIIEPKILWKQFVGKTNTLLEVRPGSGNIKLKVPVPEATNDRAETGDPTWGLVPLSQLIEGRLQPMHRSATTTYAEILTEGPGLEKLVFESGFSKPTVNGQWQNAVGRCLAWKNGAWTNIWETDPIKELFQPLPLVDDFDGDGNPEVAILPWKELLILDARSGRVKDRCAFTPGRSYGFFGAYDLDRDGKKEFVVEADFSKHVDVLGYRNGKLSLLWQREIELDISNPRTILNVVRNPVADVDGDGKLDVLVNAYNATGDRKWHLTIHNGITGEVKGDLVEECLQSLIDLDGDGVSELLTVRAVEGWVPSGGTIRVFSVKGQTQRILWQRENAAWETWAPPQPDNVNSAATRPNRDVLHRRIQNQEQLVIRDQIKGHPMESQLAMAVWNNGRFRLGPAIAGPELKALGMDAVGNLLVHASTHPGQKATLTINSGGGQILGSKPSAVSPSIALAAWDEGSPRPSVIVQGVDETIVFNPPREKMANTGPSLSPGRGKEIDGTDGSNSIVLAKTGHGTLVGDLFGDGRRQLIYVTVGPSGCSRMVACNLLGRELWHHDFLGIPGELPVPWNVGGTILWQVGHFTKRRGQDILVTNRRSMMHSEETLLLSGNDGRELWHREREISNRGVGGDSFAIADYDGDSLDDLASFHPSIFYILKGDSGKNILAMDTTWEQVPAKPVYWGRPIAGCFEGPDKLGIFFAGHSMTGLVRPNGTLVWWDALDRSGSGLPAFGNFAGDGRIGAIGIGYEDGIRCYDTATGRINWRMPVPEAGTPTGTASADINSDGRDEALIAINRTLYCLGEDPVSGKGTVLWKISFPGMVAAPSIADVDNSGKAAVLLVSADGYVYCVR